jgi:hypothetical protein
MKLLGLASLIVIVAVIAIFAIFMQQKPAVPEDYDTFAKCLTEKGAKMYGSELCTHCQDQKESFGDSWQYVTYVECHSYMGGQAPACIGAGITAYPTWEFGDGNRQLGFMEFQDLSAASGCSLGDATG